MTESSAEGHNEFIPLSLQNKMLESKRKSSNFQILSTIASFQKLILPIEKQEDQLKVDFKITDLISKKVLGTGVSSTVSKVYFKTAKKRFYALKTMKKRWLIEKKLLNNIKNEKDILTKINHPFLSNIRGYAQDKGHLYILLDYYKGGSLAHILLKNGRFTQNVAAFYITQIVLAISYLHQKNIFFRDLKPENMMLDDKGYIKLIDFGHSKEIKDRTYTLCGSAPFVAPEVVDCCFGENIGYGKEADWWILGIITYQFLSGFLPYKEITNKDTFNDIKNGIIVFPSHFSKEAKSLISQLLNHNKNERLGTKNFGQSILRHKFFKGINIEHILNKLLPSPFIPDEQIYTDAYDPPKAHEKVDGTIPDSDQYLFDFF